MNLNELRKMAWLYRRFSTSRARREILRVVWRHERAEGLRLLARMLGVEYGFLYREGEIRQYKKERNKARRRRPVKNAAGKINSRDIYELAAAEAGGGVVANSGGRKTKSANGNGGFKSSAKGQIWDALRGGL